MKVDFHSQVMHDFKAFSGKHVMHWNTPGVTFVRGENQRTKELSANGAAKSSLFDAWCWCLFGRTPLGLRNPDVLPWNNSGKPMVANHIMIGGKEHWIIRSVGPNRLTFDGEDIDQEKLEEILGFNFSLATNTILLAQDRPLFFDLVPKDKMVLFSDTLQLDRWDARSDVARNRTDECERQTVAAEQQCAATAAALEEVKQLLDEAKASAEDWAATRRVAKRHDTTKIGDLQKYFDTIQQKLDEAVLREDGASVELVSLHKEETKLLHELNSAQLVVGRAELKLRQAKENIRVCEEEIAQLAQAKSCPTCGQLVRPENLANHKVDLKHRLRDLKTDLATGVPKKLTVAVTMLEQRLASIWNYLKGFEAKQEAADIEVGRLRPEAERVRAQLAEMRRSVAADQEEVNPHQSTIKSLQTRQAKLEGEMALATKSLVEASQQGERFKFWVRGFKDIKLKLVEEVLGELEIVTNGMLDDVGLVGWEVRYAIERETKSGTLQRALHVEIQSPDSKGFVRWESWSGGERQRLKLIGTLALSDVLLAKAGVETNLEILDEPSMFFSPEGVGDLAMFLAARAKALKKSIFYVDHAALESQHFTNVLTVVKDADGAFISEE